MATNPFASILAGNRLSAEESAELAAHVAQLARSGLPLEDGLRSLADELSHGRLARVLRDVAGQLQAGNPIDAALESQRQAIPAHLRGLIVAGVRTGRLPEMLEEYVEMQRSHRDIRRRALLGLAYPVCLMVLLCLVLFIMQFLIVGQFGRMFADFGLKLPGATLVTMAVLGQGPWIALVVMLLILTVPALLWLAPHSRLAAFCLNWIPGIGPLMRWSRLAEFSHLMTLLVGNDVPLPEALRLTAGSLRSASLAVACRRMAAKVEAGRSLSESIAEYRQFPSRFCPLIVWGERTQAIAESFRATAAMCDEILHVRAILTQSILLPIFLCAIMAFVGGCIVALFLPMLDLITNLSGPSPGRHASASAFHEDPSIAPLVSILLASFFGLLLVLAITHKVWTAGQGRASWLATFLETLVTVVGWTLLIGLLCVIGVAFFGPVALAFWIVVIGVIIELFRQRRIGRQYSLLWLLTASVEKGIPLSPTIAAFANEFQGKWRFQTMRLAGKLAEGVPLPQALAQLPGLLPAASLPLVRIGCESGDLASALHKAGQGRLLCQTLYQSVVGKAFYLAFIGLFAILSFTFIAYRIIPSFSKMFSEFGLRLPPLLVVLLDVGNRFCQSGVLALLLLLAVLGMIYWGLRYLDLIQWRLPGAGWLLRNLDRAVVLDALALSTRQGQPLSHGLDALARSYPNDTIRSRLRKTMGDIARGLDWTGSLFAHGLLGRADSAVLRAAQRVGNLPWAMEEMADSNRRRLAYRSQVWLQVLFPVVIILFGVIVMLFVTSVFVCLPTLIQHLV